MAKFKSKAKGGSRLSGPVSRETGIDRRPSVTNSEWASYRLMEMGLGVESIGDVLEKACGANLVSYTKSGTLIARIPDHRVRLEAARLLTEIHGFRHMPEQKTSITVDQINAVTEIVNYDVRVLQEKAPGAMEVLRRAERLGVLE